MIFKKILSTFIVCFLCSSFFFTLEGEKNWRYELNWEWKINNTFSVVGKNSYNSDFKDYFATEAYGKDLHMVGIKINF